MADWVEFYVSSNPPLLPEAVSSVIETLESMLQEQVLEVLYDPELPGFKFITPLVYQVDVTEYVQAVLEEILECETGLVEEDPVEIDFDSALPLADVEILSNEPQLIPWPLYYQERANLEMYDAFRYPNDIQDLPFKAVWRRLESFNNINLDHLLKNYDSLWADQEWSSNLHKFCVLMSCTITHNMLEDLVFIGSNESQERVDASIQKLENLLDFMEFPLRAASHLTLTEGHAYVEQLVSNSDENHERVPELVSLGVDKAGKGKAPILNDTEYPPMPLSGNGDPFGVFASGTYQSREKSSSKFAHQQQVIQLGTKSPVYTEVSVKEWMNGMEEAIANNGTEPGAAPFKKSLLDSEPPQKISHRLLNAFPPIHNELSSSSSPAPAESIPSGVDIMDYEGDLISIPSLMDSDRLPNPKATRSSVTNNASLSWADAILSKQSNQSSQPLPKATKQQAPVFKERSWASLASKEPESERQEALFGPNVKVTVKAQKPVTGKSKYTESSVGRRGAGLEGAGASIIAAFMERMKQEVPELVIESASVTGSKNDQSGEDNSSRQGQRNEQNITNGDENAKVTKNFEFW